MDISSKPRGKGLRRHLELIALSKKSLDVVKDGGSPKGDVREACSIAAIQAVKETSNFCPIVIQYQSRVARSFGIWEGMDSGAQLRLGKLEYGVEMEALSGVSAGLLCAWDMLKPIEKDEFGQYPEVRIEDIRVIEKKKSDP